MKLYSNSQHQGIDESCNAGVALKILGYFLVRKVKVLVGHNVAMLYCKMSYSYIQL